MVLREIINSVSINYLKCKEIIYGKEMQRLVEEIVRKWRKKQK